MRSFEMRSNSITKTLINNLPFTFRDRRLAVLPLCIFLSFCYTVKRINCFYVQSAQRKAEHPCRKKVYPDSSPPLRRLLLNMQILADSLEDRFDMLEFSPAGNRPTLKSIRHYRNGTAPTIGYAYIL